MLVVDASTILRAIGEGPSANDVRTRLAEDGELAAPHLVDLEVTEALRRFVRRGALTFDRAHAAIEDLGDLNLTRYPHIALLERIWELRDRVSAYDAAYLALAEAIGVPLVTCDAELAAAADGVVEVELFRPAD